LDSLLTLSEFKSFKDKRSFIASQAGLDDFQLIFFTKKTILISLGLTDYFKADFNEEVKISRGLEIIEKEKNTTNKALRSFNFKSFNKALFTTIDINNVAIGAIFVPFKSNLSNNSKNLILSFKDQIENQIKIKELEQKLINSNKELNNKTLEIESLIDVTEIINSQQGMKKDLFENLLITILSILNASKGMVLLKDEKSGFFNIISNFNLSKEELPNKIIRITKGILKELNESKSSKIVDEPLTYELLKSSKKNCIVSPIISGEFVEGVIILFDKESRQGLIKFTQKDLRLFDSLSKKVSLAYDNIRLIDSLKSSNELVDNIMSSITTGIIMINILGEIEFVNQSAKKIFSLEEEELINNHYFMAFQTNPKLIELFEKSEIQNEVIYEDNFNIIDSKEVSHEVNLTLSPVYNENNERSGLVFSFEDLSSINKIKSTFKKYVSENIVDELLQNDSLLELGGAQNDVCVLFSDIRGFTALSETMKPSEVVYLLNTYFEAMIDVVFAHNGTLDKIIGDELMVLYGVPIKNENDSQNAVNTAIEMFKALEKFNKQIEKEKLPKLKIGIGINYGKVVSGNIGSEKQMNYTVIGDAVNLAARLCSHAKSGQIVISESVYGMLEKKEGFENQTPIMVKGKSKEINNWIFEAY
jgi:PAS domain S-box-containing protein